jgi:hypothetical protein
VAGTSAATAEVSGTGVILLQPTGGLEGVETVYLTVELSSIKFQPFGLSGEKRGEFC